MRLEAQIVGPHRDKILLLAPKIRNGIGRPSMKVISAPKGLVSVEVTQKLGRVYLFCFYEDYESQTMDIGTMDDLFKLVKGIRLG